MTLRHLEIDKDDDDESRNCSTQSRSDRPHIQVSAYTGIAILLFIDKLLHYILRNVTTFPSALIGMAIILFTLVFLRFHNHQRDVQLHQFFNPALEWITHKWLPVFYSPALITLPLALLPLDKNDLGKSVLVICIGIIATAAITGHTTQLVRKIASTEYVPVRREHKTGIQFDYFDYMVWVCIGCIAFAILVVLKSTASPLDSSVQQQVHEVPIDSPANSPIVSTIYAISIFLFLLSSTILGYILGMHCPESWKKVIHPMLMCAMAPNVAALLIANFLDSRLSYYDVLRIFLTKGKKLSFETLSYPSWPLLYGPGDLLFSFLGVIILSFGFKVYEEFDVLQRHAPEVLGATSIAAAFTMLSTAFLGGASNLPPPVARALVPRGSTLALAIPIAERLAAPTQLTAAAVALTGILGGNFIQFLMTLYKFNDPISRGLTAAATAHGLGTAAMAAKEPEGLPYAALSYALSGIFASVFASLPWFRSIILWLTG